MGISKTRASQILLATIFVTILAAVPIGFTQEYMTYEEAEHLFEQLGCTSCHNGQVAGEFEEVVAELAEWGEEYPNIDEAVRSKVVYFDDKRFNSYDELIQQMSSNVRKSPDDPDIQKMFDWLAAVFEGKVDVPVHEAGGEGADAGGEGAETGGEGEEGNNTLYLALGVAIIVILAAVLLLRK